MDPAQFASKTLDIEVRGTLFSPSYLQAAAIVFLLFLLVLSLARLRKIYVKWSLKGWHAWLFMGFLLALLLEGFLLISGRTVLTEILGWENAPKPVKNALVVGREKLVNVLGITEEVPASVAQEEPTLQGVISDFQSLPSPEAEKFRSLICQ